MLNSVRCKHLNPVQNFVYIMSRRGLCHTDYRIGLLVAVFLHINYINDLLYIESLVDDKQARNKCVSLFILISY